MRAFRRVFHLPGPHSRPHLIVWPRCGFLVVMAGVLSSVRARRQRKDALSLSGERVDLALAEHFDQPGRDTKCRFSEDGRVIGIL